MVNVENYTLRGLVMFFRLCANVENYGLLGRVMLLNYRKMGENCKKVRFNLVMCEC